MCVQNEIATTSPEAIIESLVWYPETEFCYLANYNGLFFAEKGGHNNESHNHNDVGSFIIYMDNQSILTDAGVGTYRRQTFGPKRYTIWTMQSNYHNLPMINGVSDGKLSISVEGVNALFTYEAKTFDCNIETVVLDDTRLSDIWGDKIYRLSFTAKNLVKKGNYSFNIQKVK